MYNYPLRITTINPGATIKYERVITDATGSITVTGSVSNNSSLYDEDIITSTWTTGSTPSNTVVLCYLQGMISSSNVDELALFIRPSVYKKRIDRLSVTGSSTGNYRQIGVTNVTKSITI